MLANLISGRLTAASRAISLLFVMSDTMLPWAASTKENHKKIVRCRAFTPYGRETVHCSWQRNRSFPSLHEKWDFQPRKHPEISLIFGSYRQFTGYERDIRLWRKFSEMNHDVCGACGGANGSNYHMNSSKTMPGQRMCGLTWISSLSIGWNHYF